MIRMTLKCMFTVLWLLPLVATGQDDGYVPDVLEFDGTDTLVFDPALQFDISDGGTMEFWVSPDWQNDLDFDPIIFCNAGQESISYAVGLLSQRNGILLITDDNEDVFPFDFQDGRMHHVAIHQLDDGVAVLVDGVPVGTSELMIESTPSDGLWVGSLDGENDMFRGAIAGLRFWDEIIDQETLIEYALKDAVFDLHPYLDSLTAISDFGVGEIMLIEAATDNESSTGEAK